MQATFYILGWGHGGGPWSFGEFPQLIAGEIVTGSFLEVGVHACTHLTVSTEGSLRAGH